MKTLCVVSMSGGLDSTTLAFKALSEGYDILPININYGQKNIVEMKAFQNIINFLNESQYQNNVLDPIVLDASEFIKPVIEHWQKQRDEGTIKKSTDMEFYTPSRNLFFMSVASMIGEIIALDKYDAIKVGLGIHKHQTYSRDYWDITPQFAKTFDALLSLNDCANIEIYAPYVNKYKSAIVSDAVGSLNVPWEYTWTCYNPIIENDVARPCGICEACVERQQAGENAGVSNINSYSIVIKD